MTAWRCTFEHARDRVAHQSFGLARADAHGVAQPAGRVIGKFENGTYLDRGVSRRHISDEPDCIVTVLFLT